MLDVIQIKVAPLVLGRLERRDLLEPPIAGKNRFDLVEIRLTRGCRRGTLRQFRRYDSGVVKPQWSAQGVTRASRSYAATRRAWPDSITRSIPVLFGQILVVESLMKRKPATGNAGLLIGYARVSPREQRLGPQRLAIFSGNTLRQAAHAPGLSLRSVMPALFQPASRHGRGGFPLKDCGNDATARGIATPSRRPAGWVSQGERKRSVEMDSETARAELVEARLRVCRESLQPRGIACRSPVCIIGTAVPTRLR